MKHWIWKVLGFLLLLVVVAGVGFAGFRIGMMQSANVTAGADFQHPNFGHRFNGMDGNGNGNNMPQQNFGHGRDFGGRGGFRGFSPIFGLVRLAVLGGLIWLGYTFFKRSGWKLVNINSQQAAAVPAPSSDYAPAAEGDEKKDEA